MLLKRLVLAAAIIFTASAAFAAVQDFGAFTVDVPSGWVSSQNGPTALLNNEDKSAAMSITLEAAKVNSAQALADSFARQFKSGFAEVSKPEAGADGAYSWYMKAMNGTDTLARLSVNNGNYILVTMTNIAAAPVDFAEMLKSIQEK